MSESDKMLWNGMQGLTMEKGAENVERNIAQYGKVFSVTPIPSVRDSKWGARKSLDVQLKT